MEIEGTITASERFKKNIYTFPGLDRTGEAAVIGLPDAEDSPLRYKKVIRQINEHFGIKGFELYQKPRGKVSVTFPRQIAMYVMFKYQGYSHGEIGDIIYKDRTTVLVAVRKLAGYMSLPYCKEKEIIAKFLDKYNWVSCS